MNSKVPKIKEINGELKIEGNFDLKLSSLFIVDINDSTPSAPIKRINFDFCVEIPNNIIRKYGEEVIFEMFGEQLKQDFIKLSKEKI